MTDRKTTPDGDGTTLGERISRRDALRLAGTTGLAIGAGGLLQACGGSDSGASATTAASPRDIEGTVTYIRGPFLPNELEIQAQELKPFKAQFPSIDVKTSLFDWGSRDTTLTTAFAGPNPPDVSYHSDSTWGRYGSQGALLDLTDRIMAPDFRSTYDAIPESLWEASKVDGKLYGVPVYTSLYGITGNLDTLRADGVTDWTSSWDALIAAAKKTKADDNYGWGNTFSFAEFGYIVYYGFLFSNGGTLLSEDQRSGNLDTPEGIGAFQFFKDMYGSGAAAPPGLYDQEAMQARFVSGGITAAAWGTGGLTLAMKTDRKSKDFAVAQVPYPKGPLGSRPASPASVGVLSIAAKSKNPDAAWELIRYLTGKDELTHYLKRFNGAVQSLRTDVPIDAIATPRTPIDRADVEGVRAQAPYVAIPQPVARLSDINRAICDSLQGVARGSLEPAAAAKQCNDAINQILAV